MKQIFKTVILGAAVWIIADRIRDDSYDAGYNQALKDHEEGSEREEAPHKRRKMFGGISINIG